MFRLNKNNRKQNRRNCRPRKLRGERLEERRLLAGGMHLPDHPLTPEFQRPDPFQLPWASVELDGMTLTIVGSDVADFVEVQQDGDLVAVRQLGGRTSYFQRPQVESILFRGYGGDDRFSNDTDIPCEAYGYGGSDTLEGGGAVDKLNGGTGEDTLRGNDGDDILAGGCHDDELHGGPGKDRIWDGPGNDSVWGDGGDDRFYGGCGNDWLSGGPGNNFAYGCAEAQATTNSAAARAGTCSPARRATIGCLAGPAPTSSTAALEATTSTPSTGVST